MKNHVKYLILFSFFGNHCAFSAITNIGILISSGGLKDISGTLLSRGVVNVNGDGAVLQIGYYTLATPLDPFQGQWVAMTGPGTPYLTSIGDSSYPDGLTKSTSVLVEGTFSFVEPAVGTPMVLRFYDSSSIATSSYFNAVAATDGSFAWVAPSVPQSSTGLNLPQSNIVWQDGSGSAFRTTIAIPESGSVTLLAFTSGLLVFRRRRF